MHLQRHRYILITIFSFFCLVLKLYFLLFLLLLLRDTYKWLKEDNYEINYISFDRNRVIYEEVDLETQDLDMWFYEELYLIFGCKIYYDVYGGQRILELIDYFWNDYNVYDLRNLNNIFEVFFFKTKYTYVQNYYLRNEYILYILKDKYLNKLNKKNFLDFFIDDKFFLVECNKELYLINKLIYKKSLIWFKGFYNKYEKIL